MTAAWKLAGLLARVLHDRTLTRRLAKPAGAMVGLAGAILSTAVLANEVTDVRFDATEGDLVFTLTTRDAAPQPNVFTTEQPPRIVVELPGTSSRLPTDPIPVGLGPARSVTTLSAGGRTRMVVDLARHADYAYATDGNQVTLTLVSSGAAAGSQSARTVATTPSRGDRFSVTGIDFRRGSEGQGRVIVAMDQPGASISVNERGSRVVVDVFNARVTDEGRHRLDVTDFATPVELVTPEQRGDNVRLTLQVAGAYEHMAYQSGNQLIIEVGRPQISEQAVERELQFFEEREYTGSRITLNFQDIPVRSVLQLIADVSDLNVVVSDTVGGNLTLRLTNVPWDQALDIVLETKNLDMRQSGNVIWIAPASEVAAREQQLLRARQERQVLEPLRTSMISVSYANAGELAALIQAAGDGRLLSERGSATVDQRTNTLLITDTVDRIDEVRALVAQLDRPVRQVLIESRIVIARSDFNHQLGVRFGITGGREDSRGNIISTSGSSSALDRMNNLSLVNRRLGTGSGMPHVGPDDPPAGISVPPLEERLNVNLPTTLAPAGSLGWSILAADYLLDLELSALESEGQGEVISTPRVITANQAEAYIQQGVEIPYEQATSAGATAVQFKEAVLELRVTPLITPDNRIQLDLAVKQDTVGEIYETGRGGSVPSIDTRELNTKVLIENGQTVVLGGIFQEERSSTNTKVPMLGDVPVLGVLFRRRANMEEKRELLIFVTPTILDERVVLD